MSEREPTTQPEPRKDRPRDMAGVEEDFEASLKEAENLVKSDPENPDAS